MNSVHCPSKKIHLIHFCLYMYSLRKFSKKNGGEMSHLQDSASLAGRVGFIRLDVLPPKTQLDGLDLHGENGVLGRADEFVETAPEFAVLAKRLLGKTWVVESLAHAIGLSESVGRGLSFVTREGELVAADGTLFVGPRQTATGLITAQRTARVATTACRAEHADRQAASAMRRARRAGLSRKIGSAKTWRKNISRRAKSSDSSGFAPARLKSDLPKWRNSMRPSKPS